jgi:hypothetical protein
MFQGGWYARLLRNRWLESSNHPTTSYNSPIATLFGWKWMQTE